MDVSKMTNSEKLSLCRKYFYFGFAVLPFLWFVNSVWFYWQAFRRPPFEEQKQIRLYVIYSFIGASVWFVGLLAWIITYQLNRADWGATGDSLSFNIPRGIP